MAKPSRVNPFFTKNIRKALTKQTNQFSNR
jgi:hypothetical protein